MDKLEEFQDLEDISQEMKIALDNGMIKLKSYYAKTDDSSMYSIATSKLKFLNFVIKYLLITSNAYQSLRSKA